MAKLYNLARMTTPTTGTGTLTLGSAVSGFLTFVAAGVTNGETVTYAIQDGSSSEIGRGVYTASGTTLTRTVLESTNANAAISLSGSAQVFISPAAEDFKEILEAARTYYVRTDGLDSNNGLANTSAGAFLTLQKAIDVCATIDTAIYDLTIQLAAGTYSTSVGVKCKNVGGAGTVTVIGDETTPANVILTSTGVHTSTDAAFYSRALSTTYKLKGVKLTSTATGSVNGIHASTGSYIEFQAVDFGSGFSQQIRSDDGATCTATGNYSITASAAIHVAMANGTFRCQSKTITLTGTPAWSSQFANAAVGAVGFMDGNTYTGAATGARYAVLENGTIRVSGGGASYFPGNAVGTTATGGQYN